jgi:hypothetical protein
MSDIKPKSARKAPAKPVKPVAKTGTATFLGVRISDPRFKPKNTTVKEIRAAVRAANTKPPDP